MYWADRFASQIVKSKKHKPYWVDDMKTPSGRIHVGSLRGVIIHDLLYKALKDLGENVNFSYCINDMDPMDGFPHYLPESFRQYMGKPLFKIPSPEPGYKSLAKCYAQQFIEVFNSLGAKPQIIWSSKYYKQGKFNKVIKESLDKVEEIRHLYKKISGYDKPKNWYPFQVICPRCGKVGTTLVYDWNGEKVSFECQKDLVDWAKGCLYKGKISPYDGAGKLMWKVDWAAHWKVIGVTVEWAGKDHMSEGGSYDLSSTICKQVFKYPKPHAQLYEWFLARGGSKMSSSKGIGVSAVEIANMLPAELLRFLLVRTQYRKAIIFDPKDNQSILNLFDEYDNFSQKYYSEQNSDFKRIWQLSQIKPISKTKPFLARFRNVANYIQSPSVDIYKKFAENKGDKLNKLETDILNERIKYAKIWLKRYAPREMVYKLTEQIPENLNLSEDEKKYLLEVSKILKKKKWIPEDLQQELYLASKKLNLSPRKAFQAIYLALTGKTHGPKAAWFLLDQEKKSVIKRFNDIQQLKIKPEKRKYIYKIINKPELFKIDKKFAKTYPSVTVGLAIIKGVNIKQQDGRLQTDIDNFIKSQAELTTKAIGEYPEIKSYRRIYRKTGVDWHSKRSSPEAMLRRIAQHKGLYNINTCVDAYNLVVIKNRVSAGAFNLDKIKFPTVLRFARKEDKITLLGEKKPTYYEEGNVAYFDQLGGFNIHFNYLDAERTKVTKQTKNLWINVEGVYEITRYQVEQCLKEVCDIILRYCGGKVELAGIVKP